MRHCRIGVLYDDYKTCTLPTTTVLSLVPTTRLIYSNTLTLSSKHLYKDLSIQIIQLFFRTQPKSFVPIFYINMDATICLDIVGVYGRTVQRRPGCSKSTAHNAPLPTF